MASGKKNYFRHSNNAFEDEKIQLAIDKLGYSGYAYYFILLELLAKKCENEFVNPVVIHQQSLRIVWRKQSKSCKKVVEKLQESGLFVATYTKSFIEFDIPNLSKYLGKYNSKNPPKPSNKSKVNKSKVNKSKVNESKVNESKVNEKETIKKPKKIVIDFSSDIEKIYSDHYPNKKGKQSGIKKLSRIIKTHEKLSQFEKAVKNYAMLCQVNNTENRFIKHFSTFASCWEDYIDCQSEQEASIEEKQAFVDKIMQQDREKNLSGN